MVYKYGEGVHTMTDLVEKLIKEEEFKIRDEVKREMALDMLRDKKNY